MKILDGVRYSAGFALIEPSARFGLDDSFGVIRNSNKFSFIRNFVPHALPFGTCSFRSHVVYAGTVI